MPMAQAVVTLISRQLQQNSPGQLILGSQILSTDKPN